MLARAAAWTFGSHPLARRLLQHTPHRSSNSCLIQKTFHASALRQQSIHQPQKACHVCAKPLPSAIPACTNCWNLLALPKDVTHHELFGLPYQPNPFVIDPSVLKRKFREAQSICHPDSWASKNPDKQEIAQALSARVNHAYQTLLDPLLRIEYILDRNHSHVDETDQVEDVGFMMEIMEAREAIDDAQDRNEVEALLERNEGHIQEVISELEKLAQTQDWVAAKAGAIRLRYLQGIRGAAKRWLDNNWVLT